MERQLERQLDKQLRWQSRTQSPRAFWPAGERPERVGTSYMIIISTVLLFFSYMMIIMYRTSFGSLMYPVVFLLC